MFKTLTFILVASLFIACSSKRYASRGTSLKTGKYIRLKRFEGDTLQYVTRNFVNRKDKYIGKKLKELLKDVELPIRCYLFSTSVREPGKILSLSLFLYSRSEVSRRIDQGISPSSIIIKWNTPLPEKRVFELVRKNKGEWTAEAVDYYGEQVIGDVITENY
jgi:hypothetical protein